MRNRYKVFISSTSDLRNEREIAVRAVQACDCIPVFMEIWPATAEQLTDHIRREIALCDFFLLLAGNRYGSLHSEDPRSSFVEEEYKFAHSLVEKRGMGMIVLMTDDPAPALRTDPDLNSQMGFRRRVQRDYTAKGWSDATDLTRLIMASLLCEIVTRESAQIVESNADLVAEVAAFVDEQHRRQRTITKAVLVQFSAANAKDILKKLLWAEVDTDLYIATPKAARQINPWQKAQVNMLSRENLQNFLEPLNPQARIGVLTLYPYNVRGSLRALLLRARDNPVAGDLCTQQGSNAAADDGAAEFVAIGAYIYMIRWPQGEKQEDIRGGELPMTVFRRGHPGCVTYASMIESVVANWKELGGVEPIEVPLGKAARPSAGQGG